MNAHVIGELSRITQRKCITRLHQCLAEQGIVVCPIGDKDILDKTRGVIYVLRFIAQETSFEIQPGFPKYFQLAQRYDLLSRQDADLLVNRLAALGASLRDKYHGRLINYLHTGVIGEFLDRSSDVSTLRLLEAAEDRFPDLLRERLQWPCVVDEFLMAREFSDLHLDSRAISAIAGSPIRALIAGLGMVRVGHWLGLSTGEINATLELLDPDFQGNSVAASKLQARVYAEKVIIPIFSLGFQGSIIGVFSKLERRQKMRLRSTLHEAGHCLGEQYALEHKRQLQDLLCRGELSAKVLAEVVMQIASPVEHIVVSRAGEHHAYVICKEEDYLAGYEQKTGSAAESLKLDPNNEFLDLHTFEPPAKIYIKTLRGYAALDPIIHGLRLKTALSDFLLASTPIGIMGPPPSASNGIAALDISELDRVILALKHQMNSSHGKRAAAKHLCFFEIVRDELGSREARITNAEMQKRMYSKLETLKVNGYQVTGEALRKFELEINGLLPGRFLFEPLSDKVIRVRWH